MYEHRYEMLAFGSFRLELGTRHRRWAFTWDGKDHVLEVSAAYSPKIPRLDPSVQTNSEHLAPGNPDAPFNYIAAFPFNL